MKNLLLLSLLLPLFASAQEYHPLVTETGLWTEYHNYCKSTGIPFTQYVKFGAETAIGDTVYHLVFISEDTLQGWTNNGLIREDDQHRVWLRPGPQLWEHLLYDFGAQQGDSLYPGESGYLYIVASIDSVQLLTGEYRRQFHMFCPTAPSCDEVWVEGIGCLKGVLQGGTCMMVGDDPELICALQGDTVLFHNPVFTECHVISGIVNNPEEERAITVSPNPARDEVFISTDYKITGATVTDMQGKTLLTMRGADIRQISAASLANGVYILRLEAGETVFNVRVVIRK